MAKWNGQNEINQMRCKLKQEFFEMESVGQLGILDYLAKFFKGKTFVIYYNYIGANRF